MAGVPRLLGPSTLAGRRPGLRGRRARPAAPAPLRRRPPDRVQRDLYRIPPHSQQPQPRRLLSRSEDPGLPEDEASSPVRLPLLYDRSGPWAGRHPDGTSARLPMPCRTWPCVSTSGPARTPRSTTRGWVTGREAGTSRPASLASGRADGGGVRHAGRGHIPPTPCHARGATRAGRSRRRVRDPPGRPAPPSLPRHRLPLAEGRAGDRPGRDGAGDRADTHRAEDAPTASRVNRLALVGDRFEIPFGADGGRVEQGRLPRAGNKGLAYYHLLLREPGRDARADRAGADRRGGCTPSPWCGASSVEGREGFQTGAPSTPGSTGGPSSRRPEEDGPGEVGAVSGEGVRDTERVGVLERELDELRRLRRGRLADRTSPGPRRRGQASLDRVRKALVACRRKLHREGLGELALYLDGEVMYMDGAWQFRPQAGSPHWET